MKTKVTVLVLGATGQTGKHVVTQLLQQGHDVHAIVRSKQTFFDAVNEITSSSSSDNTLYDAAKDEKLSVIEAAVLDLTDDKLTEHVRGVDAVVSCLGHNLTFKGMYGHPRRLVTDATARLCAAIICQAKNTQEKKITKFILMGSDGVANPEGTDDKRSFLERVVLFLLRSLVPPHADNEGAASYLYQDVGVTAKDVLEWAVVRPTDLIDGKVSEYNLFPKPIGGLFGSGQATRSNVAKCMVNMILEDGLWGEWKFKMPVLHDVRTKSDSQN